MQANQALQDFTQIRELLQTKADILNTLQEAITNYNGQFFEARDMRNMLKELIKVENQLTFYKRGRC